MFLTPGANPRSLRVVTFGMLLLDQEEKRMAQPGTEGFDIKDLEVRFPNLVLGLEKGQYSSGQWVFLIFL